MSLSCPKCGGQMEKVTYEASVDSGIIAIFSENGTVEKMEKSFSVPKFDSMGHEIYKISVDRCLECGGIWFDKGEDVALKNLKFGQSVDSAKANADVVAKHICPCPHCGIPLKDEVYIENGPQGKKCEKCGGVFLNAGEFKDL